MFQVGGRNTAAGKINGEPRSPVAALLRDVSFREGPCANTSAETQTLADSGGTISVMEILPLTVLWMTSTAELTLSVLL